MARAQARNASVAIPGKSASSANSFTTPSFSKVTMRSMMPNKDSIRAPRLSETEAMKRADSCAELGFGGRGSVMLMLQAEHRSHGTPKPAQNAHNVQFKRIALVRAS